MSETAVATTETEDGKVTITISEESVKYDSNLTVPDLVFWLEVVKSMAISRGVSEPTNS